MHSVIMPTSLWSSWGGALIALRRDSLTRYECADYVMYVTLATYTLLINYL